MITYWFVVLLIMATNIQYKWFGPLRVVEVYSHLVYSLAKFNGKDSQRIISTRLICYCPKLGASQVSKEMLELADHTTAKYEAIDSFVNIAKNLYQKIMERVRWYGLLDEREWKWHRAEHMYEDE